MNRKGMQNIFVKRLSGLLCAWLFPFAALYAQVDTTTYHQLSGVEVLGKVRPSTTRESTPLQVMDKAGIERLGVQDLSEAVKRFSGVTVQDYGGIGGLKTVSVRSLGAKHTAVCYDGVTVTDAQSGQVDISRFSLDNVDMISLSIGQADDIFQTARMYASAGALSIKTSRPRCLRNNRTMLMCTTERRFVRFGQPGVYGMSRELGKSVVRISGMADWLTCERKLSFYTDKR